MNLFCEQISRIEYRAGVVSLCITPKRQGASAFFLNIPFDDFEEFVRVVSDELEPIANAHTEFLKEGIALSDRKSRETTRSEGAKKRKPSLGPEIGKV